MATEPKIPKLCPEEAEYGPEESENELEKVPQIHFLPTDVILEVEGRDIHVNKQVLADNSPVFKAMFESDFTEKHKERISLPGKKYADFVNFLYTFYYADRLDPITENTILKIIPLAEEYQISSVKARCERFLKEVCQSAVKAVDKHIETCTLVNYTACAERFNMDSVLSFAIQLCAKYPAQSLKLAGIETSLTADVQRRIAELRITLLENELVPALTAGKDILNSTVLLWDTLNPIDRKEFEDRLVSSCEEHQSRIYSSNPVITKDTLLGYIIAAERYNLEELLTAAIDLASKCTNYDLRQEERYEAITESTKYKIIMKRMKLFEDILRWDSITKSKYDKDYNKL